MAIPLNVRMAVVKKRSKAGRRPVKARPRKAFKLKGCQTASKFDPSSAPNLDPGAASRERARPIAP